MNIGQAASLSGVPAKTIRHYESIGLLTPAGRTASGYRIYDESSVHTLRFIRRARRLDFPPERVRKLLALWQDQSRASSEAHRVALSQLTELRERAEALDGMIRTLRRLVDDCRDDDWPECPILDDLAAAPPAPST